MNFVLPSHLSRQKLVDQGVSLVDHQIHTYYSDGADDPAACVRAAQRRKLTEIAFTDHVWRSSEWVESYAEEIEQQRRTNPDLRILTGVEAKAVDHDGHVDIASEAVSLVDYVMGVVHRYQPDVSGDLAKLGPVKAAEMETAITCRLLENPIVSVIGHPARTYYKFFYPEHTRDPFPAELIREMATKAKACGKPLEVNAKVPHLERFLQILLEEDAMFTIGSDAHRADEVGDIDFSMFSDVLNKVDHDKSYEVRK